MRRFPVQIAAVIFIFSAAGFTAEPPHIGYIYPAGGRLGTVIEVLVGGKNIREATAVHVTGGKVSGQVLEDPDKDLVLKRAEDTKFEEVTVIPKKLDKENLKPSNFKFDLNTTVSKKEKASREKRRNSKKNKKDDPFPDTVKIKITIAEDALPGDRELRVITSAGLSNKFTFQVGQLPEVYDAEPNNRPEQATKIPSLPALLNGQILQGLQGTQSDVDYYSFKGRKGQDLVVTADIRKLLPYIADGVPGWFQGTLAILDSKGTELIHSDNFRFSQDPVILYTVPEDGEYFLEVRDSIYRGREDFVYRISIGALPYITHIYPLGTSYGTSTFVRLYGKNLPVTAFEAESKDRKYLVQSLQVRNKENILSNKVLFAFSDLPEVSNQNGNNSPEKARLLKLPVIVNGRITGVGVKDYYSFLGRAGQAIAIEVAARSLGSPLDSYIILTDSKGVKIADNDDDLTYKGEGMSTHHADSALLIKLPADGVYTLEIRDMQNKGGEEYAYRLRVSEPLPDFEVNSFPPNLTVPRGGTASFKAKVVRKDGFTGPVQLALQNDLGGLRLDSSVIPEGKTEMNLTVTAGNKVKEGISACRLEATGVVQGRKITRPVISAEDYMQAFAWKHLVPVSDQLVLVTPPMPYTLAFAVPSGKIFELTQGKESSIPIDLVRNPDFQVNLQLQLLDPPPGIILRNSSFRGGNKDRQMATLRVESKVNPGLYENLVLVAVANVPVADPENPDNKSKREKIFVTAPALPVVVLKGKEEKKPPEKNDIKKIADVTPERTVPGNLVGEKKGITVENKK